MKALSPSLVRIVLLAFCWVALLSPGHGQVVTILNSFRDAVDGSGPVGQLVQGSDATFYGTTQSGGAGNSGTVFKIIPLGGRVTLHYFGDGTVANDGAFSRAGLVLGADSNFYGTTLHGGVGGGTVFKMTPQGVVTILHRFGDGSIPQDGTGPMASLVQGGDGNFYGTTSGGGTLGNGTVFKITPNGALTILHNFAGATDGIEPAGALVQGADGNFYGTTETGGSPGIGTVFKITPSGTETVLYRFVTTASGGSCPNAGLIQGTDGNFYGTTTANINGSMASIFKITPQGVLTVLHSFGDPSVLNDGRDATGVLVQGSDGNIYGTTQSGGGPAGNGCIFEISSSGQYSILHSFGDGSVANDGLTPVAGLTQGANGILYGVTLLGGLFAEGTAFSLDPNALVLTSPPTASGSLTTPFTYQITASKNPTAYGATNLPPGLGIDPVAGTISGTPTTTGTYAVTLTITNATGPSNFPLTITIGGQPTPTVTSAPVAYGSVGASFSYATQATNTPTSYVIAGTLPNPLQFNSSTGSISGTPTIPGIFSVSLSATNASGTGPAIILVIQIFGSPPTVGQEYGILHSFQDGSVPNDGREPGSILQAFDGNFYGVTQSGGDFGAGAVFKMTPQGTTSTFYAFSPTSGATPPTTLLQAADGSFYGTTATQVFQLTQSGQLSILHYFGSTAQLYRLYQGLDGNFYGMSGTGGSAGFGMVYKMTPQGTVTVLHNFGDGTVSQDGNYPSGGLIQGTDGNFYGTTNSGGHLDNGTVFKMTPQGAETNLHVFEDGSVNNDGSSPTTGVIQASDGNFYGVAGGGSTSNGVIYKVTSGGATTILHSFGVGNDGGYAGSALIQGFDGNFYGINSGIYQVTPAGAVTVFHTFGDGTVPNDGTGPSTSLIQSSAGDFYGATSAGGSAGQGTVYSIHAAQTATHVPVFVGAAYQASAIGTPFSFTPKATFGASLGSGVETGSSVKSQSLGASMEAALVSILPQSIQTDFLPPNRWSLTGTLPSNLTFDFVSGTIAGTPVQAGNFIVALTPQNAVGLGTPQTVTLFIAAPLAITSAATGTATVGSAFTYQIVTSPTNATSYGATNLPGWLSIDPVAGVISGTPPAAGTFQFTVTATNLSGATSQIYTLTVGGGSASLPLITSATQASATVGTPFTYQITTSNPATPYSALSLPTGLVFNANTGTISGTPSAAGVFPISLTATNASGSYGATLTLTVASVPAPGLPSSLSATAGVGVAFSYQIPATGIVSAYNASLLPLGLTINNTTGLISGTATNPGIFQITLAANNGSGTSSSVLTLVVNPSVSFPQWEAIYNVTGPPTASPLQDGVANLLKYFFDINPTASLNAADRAALPIVSTTVIGGTQYFTLTYRQYAAATGVTVNLQISTDLQNWTTVVPSAVSTLRTDPATGDPVIQLQAPVAAAREFVRLNIVAGSASVNTVPEGIMTMNLASHAINYVSLPLSPDPVHTGVISAVTANTISIPDIPAPWTTGAFAAPGSPFLMRLLSGNQAGRVILITANDTKSLTLDTTDGGSQNVSLVTSGFNVAAGDAIEVFPGNTLASFFGNNTAQNPLLLNGGTSAVLADAISIYDAPTFRFLTYYFNTTAGYWEATGSPANANNTILYPSAALAILPRQSALALVNSGRVPEVALLTKTPGSSAVVYSSTQYPVDQTLSNFNFGSSWTRSASPSTADTVSIWSAAQQRYFSYYQLPDLTWRKMGSPSLNQSSLVIPAGTSVGILKRGTASGASCFIPWVLPYTLN